MKLVLALFFCFIIQANSKSLYAQNISVNVKNATLKNIITIITDQTDYEFAYDDALLQYSLPVTLNVKNQNIQEVLNKCFKNQPLAYLIKNNTIIITSKLITQENQARIVEIISGKIISDSDQKPLIGVSVKVKNKQTGTITDANGNFKISANIGDILIVSYIGFNDTEFQIINANPITISLIESITSLNNVVVVGYGTQLRKNITGSISSISAKDIEKSTSIGIEQAIQGRAAGVQVVTNSGQPGSGIQIRVRGTGSLLGGNEPLYVIDGFPINNEQTGSEQGGQDRINGMAGINPSDIASIEILKDAAAQAIYGSRGANGVVLITTKRGLSGKTIVSLSTFSGFQTFNNFYDLLDGNQFIDLVKDAAIKYPALNVNTTKLNTNANTDWQKQIFQTGFTQSTNASIQGGTDNTKYFVSGSFYNQSGVIVGSGYNRATIRSNIDQKISDKIKVGLNVYGSKGVNNRIRNNGSPNFQDNYNGNNSFGPNVVSSALVANPLYAPKSLSDAYNGDTTGIGTNNQNPLALAKEADLRSNNFRGIVNAYAEVNILKGLKYRFNGGFDFRREEENFYFPPVPNLFGSGRVTVGGYDERNNVIENFLTYQTQLATVHNITLVAGQSYQYSKFQSSIAGVSGVTLPGIRTLDAGTLNPFARNSIEDYAFSSFYARLNYDYKEKYLIQLSARSDGSSRFGTNNKYGFFPAASIAWKISSEDFMQNQKLISDLRLRASLGRVGNAEVGNYDWRARLSPLRAYLGGTGVTVLNFANLDYSWENVEQLNLGLNVGFLKDRFNFSADFYKRTTRDFLFNSRIPQTTGFSTSRSNAGDLQNTGVELGLESTNFTTSNFTWKTNFNISFNKIELTRKNPNVDDIQAGPFGNSIKANVGEKIGYYIWQLQKNVDPQTGNLVVVDQNNDKEINDLDRVYQGSPFPKHTGGFNNDFTYKNFDLSVFFQWSYGNKIYNSSRAFIEEMSRGNNQSTTVLNRWRKPGDITPVPVVSWDGRNSGFVSSRFLEDGSYLRLKNVQIGYRFDPKLLTKLKIQGLRIYATGQNLLTFTKYSGYDPEVSGTTGRGLGSSLGVGEDFGTYPQARTYVFGINVNF